MVRYLILMAGDPETWERASADERRQVLRDHAAFDRAVRERGRMVAGEALADATAATTLRSRNDAWTLTDGPFAETAEQIGGFYLIDVADLDVAVDLCRLLPRDYTIELRPTIEIEEADITDR